MIWFIQVWIWLEKSYHLLTQAFIVKPWLSLLLRFHRHQMFGLYIKCWWRNVISSLAETVTKVQLTYSPFSIYLVPSGGERSRLFTSSSYFWLLVSLAFSHYLLMRLHQDMWQFIPCFSFPAICPVSVKFSKRSFFIMSIWNFNCFWFYVEVYFYMDFK